MKEEEDELRGRSGGKLTDAIKAKMRLKRRKENPDFALVQDAIAASEQKFSFRLHTSLKNCAYFPPRPALKFLPSPEMAHALLFEAICL